MSPRALVWVNLCVSRGGRSSLIEGAPHRGTREKNRMWGGTPVGFRLGLRISPQASSWLEGDIKGASLNLVRVR